MTDCSKCSHWWVKDDKDNIICLYCNQGYMALVEEAINSW